MSSTEDTYPESLVPILLQSYLALAGFPRFNYTIMPITQQDEAVKGYDGSIDLQIFTFYVQFKKPFLATKTVVSQRSNHHLPVGPEVLSFKLHQSGKGKNKGNWQHDALCKLSEREKVAYVCPLYLRKIDYEAALRVGFWQSISSWLRGTPPFVRDPIRIFLHPDAPSIQIEDIPTFRGHISIPLTHNHVFDHKTHQYSFTSHGQEACFHSPNGTPVRSMILSAWLRELYENSRNKGFDPKTRKSRQRLSGLCKIFGLTKNDLDLKTKPSLNDWRSFGTLLESRFNIRQYAFIRPAQPR